MYDKRENVPFWPGYFLFLVPYSLDRKCLTIWETKRTWDSSRVWPASCSPAGTLFIDWPQQTHDLVSKRKTEGALNPQYETYWLSLTLIHQRMLKNYRNQNYIPLLVCIKHASLAERNGRRVNLKKRMRNRTFMCIAPPTTTRCHCH